MAYFISLTYLLQLFYLWKLSIPKQQIKKMKSWKFYWKMRFWFLKNLCLSKPYGAWRLLHKFPEESWKLGSIDSLLKRIHKTGTIIRQAGSGTPRSAHSGGGPWAQSEGQAKKALISSWGVAWTGIFHSNVYRIIHRNLQLKLVKRRRAQLLSEASRISHHTLWSTILSCAINLVIVFLFKFNSK